MLSWVKGAFQLPGGSARPGQDHFYKATLVASNIKKAYNASILCACFRLVQPLPYRTHTALSHPLHLRDFLQKLEQHSTCLIAR